MSVLPIPDPGPRLRPPTDWHAVGRPLAVTAAGLAVVITLMFTAYTAGFAKPGAHDIPVAVVGPAAVVTQLDRSPALQARPARDVATARRRILHRDTDGALDLSHPGTVHLLTASGGGHSVAQALTKVAQTLASRQHARLTSTELAPTSPNDPAGTVEFYCIVFLAVGAALGSSVLARVHGPVEARVHFFERFGLIAGYSFVLAGTFVLAADVLFGALTDHAGWLLLALWGYTAAIGVAAAGVAELFGAAAGVVLTLLFTLIGNTSAGGAVGKPMLPGFFRAMNPVFPHGGGLSIVRGLSYFGGRGIGAGVLCLAIWAVCGLALLRLAALRRTRAARRAAASTPGPDAATVSTASNVLLTSP